MREILAMNTSLLANYVFTFVEEIASCDGGEQNQLILNVVGGQEERKSRKPAFL